MKKNNHKKKKTVGIWKKQFKLIYKSISGRTKTFLSSVGLDCLSLGVLILLIFTLNLMIMGTLLNLSGGTGDLSNLQNRMLAMEPSEADAFYGEFTGFVIKFVLLSIFSFFAIFFVYSYTRRIIWEKLFLKKKFKWSWRWFWFAIILTIIFFIINVLLYLIIALIFILPSKFDSLNIVQVLQALATFLVFIFMLNILFALKMSFAHIRKIGDGVAAGFNLIKKKRKTLLVLTVYQFLVFLILTLAISVPLKYLASINYTLLSFIQLVIFILFLSWARIYFYQTIKPTEN